MLLRRKNVFQQTGERYGGFCEVGGNHMSSEEPDEQSPGPDAPAAPGTAQGNGPQHAETERGDRPMTKIDGTEFYLGENSTIEGATLEVTGTAQIDGTFSGKLKTTHLAVGEKGRVSGQIVSETGDIEGIVEETISLSGKLTVRSTGRIKGEISYGSLEAHEGAQLVGTINTQTEPGQTGRSSISNVRTMLGGDDDEGPNY
jgi:cytoskeletal protein CcmA (bactofilin family)